MVLTALINLSRSIMNCPCTCEIAMIAIGLVAAVSSRKRRRTSGSRKELACNQAYNDSVIGRKLLDIVCFVLLELLLAPLFTSAALTSSLGANSLRFFAIRGDTRFN